MEEFRNSRDRSVDNYINTVFKCFRKYKSELLLIHNNGLSYLFLVVLNRIFENSADSARLRVADRYRRYFHAGGIYNFLVLWLSSGMTESPEELTEIVQSIYPGGAVPVMLS